jgi:hypothetical protein
MQLTTILTVSVLVTSNASAFTTSLSLVKDCSGISSRNSNMAVFATSEESPTVLKTAQHYLTGSDLIYFLAELRQLSYCGHTITHFSKLDKFNKEVDPEHMTTFKLLETVLRELNSLILRQVKKSDKDEWRSNAR